MAITPTSFKAAFPEYGLASDALVQSRIDQATRRTSEDVWGDMQDDGIMYLAAHLLSMLPASQPLTRNERPGESVYLRERERLEMIVSGGYRSTGAL